MSVRGADEYEATASGLRWQIAVEQASYHRNVYDRKLRADTTQATAAMNRLSFRGACPSGAPRSAASTDCSCKDRKETEEGLDPKETAAPLCYGLVVVADDTGESPPHVWLRGGPRDLQLSAACDLAEGVRDVPPPKGTETHLQSLTAGPYYLFATVGRDAADKGVVKEMTIHDDKNRLGEVLPLTVEAEQPWLEKDLPHQALMLGSGATVTYGSELYERYSKAIREVTPQYVEAGYHTTEITAGDGDTITMRSWGDDDVSPASRAVQVYLRNEDCRLIRHVIQALTVPLDEWAVRPAYASPKRA